MAKRGSKQDKPERTTKVKRVLNVEPVFRKIEYFCSENSAATVLNYLGYQIDPITLHNYKCDSFDTIDKCLPHDYVKMQASVPAIRQAINLGKPVIVSVIPDANVEYWTRHSIVIIGYSPGNVIVIDDGKKYSMTLEDFDRIWKRDNKLAYISLKEG